MAIQNFFTSRDNNVDADTYVGQDGRLWYRIDTNNIWISDGNTPGGIPLNVTGNIGNIDSIQFNTAANITANTPGRLWWNAADDTLDLYQENGVVQQIGQESYAYVRNRTGNAIPKGSAVRFAGAEQNGQARLLIAPFIANGTVSTLYGLGVTAEDIANGADGLVTVWGKVVDIDTSAFDVGDVLYVSPTVAGALTDTRPTAPDNVVPMAAVLKKDAVSGEIQVRPNYEIQKDYGSFFSNQNQPIGNANVAANVTFSNTVASQQIVLVDGSKITFRETGFYQMTVDYQVVSTNASAKDVYFWYATNGNNTAATTRIVTLTGNNEYKNVTISYNISAPVANTFVQFRWASTDSAVSLTAVANTAFAPSAPSVQLDIIQSAL
jgi:hypothetical protein